MKKTNFKKEWDFIIKEIHKKTIIRKNIIKREILFALQIFLSRYEFDIYFKLKKFI
jgi:hypothetical protein